MPELISDLKQQPKQELHIVIEDEQQKLVELLSNRSGLSSTVIKIAMQKGCVWLTRKTTTNRVRRAKKPLKVADEVHFYYNPEVLQQTTADAELIADQDGYSVWYKPYGMMCQGSKWSDHTTINRFAETTLSPERSAFIVHRLDKATTGIMVLAHSKSVARHLSNAFEQRKTAKVYQAIVHGDLSEKIANSTSTITGRLTIDDEINGKTAISHVRILSVKDDKTRTLVEVAIETGRKHQIRIHLSNLGFPIVGDRLHGIDGVTSLTEPSVCVDDLQLCAVYLKFPCPQTGEDKEFHLEDKYQLSL